MTAANDGQSLTESDPIDEAPDMVFRVSLPTLDQPIEGLEGFYRQTVKDLLEIVRFSFRGKPVLIDGFAFRNRPDTVIPILHEEERSER